MSLCRDTPQQVLSSNPAESPYSNANSGVQIGKAAIHRFTGSPVPHCSYSPCLTFVPVHSAVKLWGIPRRSRIRPMV